MAKYWTVVGRTDSRARALADRHYSRKVIGAREFCPPGNNVVLIHLTGDIADALWVSHRPDPKAHLVTPRMDGFHYWDNPYFRNENASNRSSEMIREAIAITLHFWGNGIEIDGFHSFVNPVFVKPIMRHGTPIYGYCFDRAGFVLHPDRTQSRNLWRWVMSAKSLQGIEPIEPLCPQLSFASLTSER